MARINIKKIDDSLSDLKSNLQNHNRVVYVRFGDNDIFHIVNKDSKGRKIRYPLGSNRTVYTEELGNALKAAFHIKDPRYMRAVGVRWPIEPGMRGSMPFSGSGIPVSLNRYVRSITDETDFYHPVLFSFLACVHPEKSQEFYNEYIVPRNKIFVGSNDPEKLTPLGKFYKWIRTPIHNAPIMYKQVKEELLDTIQPNDMVILGCGQLSRMLAGNLWLSGKDIHVIDIGSHIDGYVGKVTRNYLKHYSKCLHTQSQSLQSQAENQD